MRARSPAEARALAYTTPTSSAPTRPGPAVTATASTAPQLTPASSSARSTTAGSVARWARLASSGTTPPNTLCTSCDRMTRLASSGRPRSPTSTAAEVSSHEVSMPRRTSATAPALALQGHGVGDSARRDAVGRLDGEPGVAARAGGAHEMRHHAQAVAGEALHARGGAADAHLDALRDELPAGEARGRGRDGDAREHALGTSRRAPESTTMSTSRGEMSLTCTSTPFGSVMSPGRRCSRHSEPVSVSGTVLEMVRGMLRSFKISLPLPWTVTAMLGGAWR